MDSVTLPSMTISQLNNFVIKLRNPAKTAKAQVVQKLIRKLKELKSKEKEDTKSKNKIERVLKEIDVIQKTNINILITFSLANQSNLDVVSKHSSIELTAFTRFCMNKSMATVVAAWRKEHGDWQRLANYWRNHVSQRKKKKPIVGRDTLLLVEKVLLSGKKDGVKVILKENKSEVKEKAMDGVLSDITRLNDLNEENEDDKDSEDDVDCKNNKSKEMIERNVGDTDAEKVIKKKISTSDKMDTQSIDNKTKRTKTKDNKINTDNPITEQSTKKELRKSLETEEEQIKKVTTKEIVAYDSSVGIQRFLMEDLDAGGEMNVGGCMKVEDLKESKVKSKTKISSMFEGGEDEEEEGEVDEDSVEKDNGGFQLNKTRKGFDFKIKPISKDNSKYGMNKGATKTNKHNATNKKFTIKQNTKFKDNQANIKGVNKTNNESIKKTEKGSHKDEDSEMHPSWLAKKKQKELLRSTFAGKKIVFDD